MDAAEAGKEVIVWTGQQRCELIARLLDVMGQAVQPIGVGGPPAGGGGPARLAANLGCDHEDDLRKLIVEHPAAFLLLGEIDHVATDDLKTAAAANTIILSLEPFASDFDTLEQLEPIAAFLHLLPGFVQSPGALSAANPAEALDDRRVVGFDSVGHSASLYARLWDAWSVVLSYIHTPQSIDAALTAAGSATAGDEVPEQLPQLAGRLTAHGRLPEGGSVVLELADATGTDRRQLHVVADNAELRITDRAYELHQSDGQLLDSAEAKGPVTWVDLIALHWRRLLDRPTASVDAAAANLRDRAVLACCLATLLSARTGEPESPADLLRMHV